MAKENENLESTEETVEEVVADKDTEQEESIALASEKAKEKAKRAKTKKTRDAVKTSSGAPFLRGIALVAVSALLMAEYAPDAQITTVDRNEEMIGFAKENLAKYDSRKQITLVEGDAAEVLQDLDTDYDFVFMDSAKSKYIVFLPEILKRLTVGGVIVFDDIFQGGDIAKDIMEVRRGQRTIYRGLHRLFDATLDNPDLTASLIPMSDGLLMIRKNSENVILPD